MSEKHSHRHDENLVADLPHASLEALREAMWKEGAPDEWFEDLAWIMAQESEGRVGAVHPTSTARGLYQIPAFEYSLLPHGEWSFGNAVEEAQGGIRYIRRRYATAAQARAAWQPSHVY
jgi:SLT domain-containing protein